MFGIIVLCKIVGEMQKLFEDLEVNVQIELFDIKIWIIVGMVVLMFKLIDGIFLDYGWVILQGNDKEMWVDWDEFKEVVDWVLIIFFEWG